MGFTVTEEILSSSEDLSGRSRFRRCNPNLNGKFCWLAIDEARVSKKFSKTFGCFVTAHQSSIATAQVQREFSLPISGVAQRAVYGWSGSFRCLCVSRGWLSAGGFFLIIRSLEGSSRRHSGSSARRFAFALCPALCAEPSAPDAAQGHHALLAGLRRVLATGVAHVHLGSFVASLVCICARGRAIHACAAWACHRVWRGDVCCLLDGRCASTATSSFECGGAAAVVGRRSPQPVVVGWQAGLLRQARAMANTNHRVVHVLCVCGWWPAKARRGEPGGMMGGLQCTPALLCMHACAWRAVRGV